MSTVPDTREFLTMVNAGQADLAVQVIKELEAEHGSKPSEVFYQLRSDPYWHDDENDGLTVDVREEKFERAPGTLWERARWVADLLSCRPPYKHLEVFQVEVYTDFWTGAEVCRAETYVVSHGNQWRADDGHLHQISSAGFCWDCLQPDPDLSIPQRGLIRHPVTPEELGNPPYACFVCKLDTTVPNMAHELTDHTVIWGEEAHPRCASCGLGYQTANPGGIGYQPHRPDCAALRPAS